MRSSEGGQWTALNRSWAMLLPGTGSLGNYWSRVLVQERPTYSTLPSMCTLADSHPWKHLDAGEHTRTLRYFHKQNMLALYFRDAEILPPNTGSREPLALTTLWGRYTDPPFSSCFGCSIVPPGESHRRHCTMRILGSGSWAARPARACCPWDGHTL